MRPIFGSVAVALIGLTFGIGSRPKGALQNRRDCPWHEDSLRPVPTSVVGPTARIPEYNDCQRFIVKAAGGRFVFDSLYAIYANPQTLLIEPDGVARLAALIKGYGNDYPPLLIKAGYNCLYVYVGPQGPVAKMRSVADSTTVAGRCKSKVNSESLQGKELVVRVMPVADVRLSKARALARWDFDGSVTLQYIGVKCGRNWCEIGPPGFHSSPGWQAIPGASTTEQSILSVKGWYDEQVLADTIPGSTVAHVSGAVGTVFPAPDLDTWTDASFQNTWRLVALVALSDHLQKYENMNIVATPAAYAQHQVSLASLNRIELCTGNSCQPQPDQGYVCEYQNSPLRWGWARIRRAGATTGAPNEYKYFCVARWDHTTAGGAPVVAAARWRWLADDETSWTKCSAGCCEVH